MMTPVMTFTLFFLWGNSALPVKMTNHSTLAVCEEAGRDLENRLYIKGVTDAKGRAMCLPNEVFVPQ